MDALGSVSSVFLRDIWDGSQGHTVDALSTVDILRHGAVADDGPGVAVSGPYSFTRAARCASGALRGQHGVTGQG